MKGIITLNYKSKKNLHTSILNRIVEQTKTDLETRKRAVPKHLLHSCEEFGRRRRDFAGVLAKPDQVTVIAEIKKASPSKGIIRSEFDPVLIAEQYEKNGASALSVLTDEPFFKGSLSCLRDISAVTNLPVLRKDFIVDEYQLSEARAFGADAVLLIVKILDKIQLYELHHAARELGLQVLVECYDQYDRDLLDFDKISIVGVNNRNLDTFEVDLHRGVALLAEAPDGVLRVSESGLRHPADLKYLCDNGIHSALIGEHFMRAEDPGKELLRFTNTFCDSVQNDEK